jgi:hypothetical protein
MKRVKQKVSVILAVTFIVFASSCKTSQRGIVPCPSYGKSVIPAWNSTVPVIKPA